MSDDIAKILDQAGASVAEAGKVLGLSPEGVRRAIKRGAIPAVNLGPKTTIVPTSWLRKALAVEA
jgi:hypothetical protein